MSGIKSGLGSGEGPNRNILALAAILSMMKSLSFSEISVLSVCRGLSGGDWTSPGISDNP